MEHATLIGFSPNPVPRSSFLFVVSCTSSPLPRNFCCFWFPLLDYFPFFNMIIVAQPRHAFAGARGRGKTGVTVTVTGFSLRFFSSSSIFTKTLREEPSLHQSEFPIHVHGPVFMALCRLSRVPWSEVEGQTSPHGTSVENY